MSIEENNLDLASAQKLTSRQKSVLVRIDRRVPIKVIANELGVSETRINQHIRALKDIFEAGSLNELVEKYRAAKRASDEAEENAGSVLFRKPEYKKKQLPDETLVRQEMSRDLSSAQSAGSHAPSALFATAGADQQEPKIVPGMLDGDNAILFRLAAIVGIAFGILAAVVLSVTAAMALSEAMDGVATIPVEK